MKGIMLIFSVFTCLHGTANIRLPKIFGDGMVLQRNKPIPVWGWAESGEKVTIRFHSQVQTVKAGKDGRWKAVLTAEPAGGPYQLSVTGRNQLIIRDVLVGEVWICSGQSNMEMNVRSSRNAEEEMSHADFPQIRHIKLPNVIADKPADDLTGGKWQTASDSTVGSFSAVGYFFARKLFQELKVPIGLINASWGGTIAETWTSREALEGSEEFKNLMDSVSFADIVSINEKGYQDNLREMEAREGALPTASASGRTAFMTRNDSWKKMNLPVNFNLQGLERFDGTIWFQKSVVLGGADLAQGAILKLGTIDDADETYVNGKLVGSTNDYSVFRQYQLPAGILKEGENLIAVRVTDNLGNGGFFSAAAEMTLACGARILPLAGEWSYRIEALKKNAVDPNSYPSLLYNSMIHPLASFAVRGVIWYQGESNALRAGQYKTAFPLLINDWRHQFQQGDLPFYFVQLASYTANNGNSSTGSEWAELREAQTATLSLPNTGMAVALDIGESNDIHPKNKQDVGLRLAAIALNRQYGKNTPFAGPVFQSMQIQGDKAIVRFSNAAQGFQVRDKYGYIRGFEVAGSDRQFHFARAVVKDGEIAVSCDSVAVPVAVRYGWADDMPEVNLYNSAGFPAVPFRTDDWKSITAGKKFRLTK